MAALEMPQYIRTKQFDLNLVQQISPTGEFGFLQTLNRTAPFWMANFETGGLTEPRWQEWINFFDQLEGSIGTFLAYDPRRPMPYAYRTQSLLTDPWTLTGQVAPRITAQDYGNSQITLDRLQTGAIITRGDYVSAQIGNIWYLFRSQDNVTVTGTNTVILDVKPRPNILALVATNIRYRRACIEMKMIGKQDEKDTVDDLPSFTFKGGQYTNRIPA